MKLSFAALVFLLATVAGSFPSPVGRESHGAQRSSVAKRTVGHSSSRSRVKTHPNEGYLTSAAKPANPIRGNIGKTNQQQHTPTSNPETRTGKSSNELNNRKGKKNKVQPTRSPKTNPSIGKSKNAKSGTDGQINQHTPTSNPKTRTGKSSNALNNRKGKKNEVQPTRTPKTNPSIGKSKNAKSGTDGQIKQQRNLVTNYTLTSTFKPPTAENLGNLSIVKDKKIHQNVSQQTSTLKPLSEEFRNSSSDKIRETRQQQNNFSSRTDFYHNYVYHPPQQINYDSAFHPVYQGHPPVYVYEYRDSGSRFDNLLTGLALYNLGRNSQLHHYNSDRQYSSTSGEICKLGISKQNGEYEETRIDCNLMSSFIWEGSTSAARNEQHVVKNTTEETVTPTVNGTGNSSVTTMTVTSNTVEDALKVKGPSIAVTPGMTCYMIRTLGAITVIRKSVDCGLLQEYARSSLHRSVAQCVMPFMSTAFNFLIIFIARKYCEQFI